MVRRNIESGIPVESLTAYRFAYLQSARTHLGRPLHAVAGQIYSTAIGRSSAGISRNHRTRLAATLIERSRGITPLGLKLSDLDPHMGDIHVRDAFPSIDDLLGSLSPDTGWRELGPAPKLPKQAANIIFIVGFTSIAMPFLLWLCVHRVRNCGIRRVRRPPHRPPGSTPCKTWLRSWHGWTTAEGYDRRHARREHFTRCSEQSGWRSAKQDYSWVFWDPDGKGQREYQERRDRKLGFLPKWLRSYPPGWIMPEPTLPEDSPESSKRRRDGDDVEPGEEGQETRPLHPQKPLLSPPTAHAQERAPVVCSTSDTLQPAGLESTSKEFDFPTELDKAYDGLFQKYHGSPSTDTFGAVDPQLDAVGRLGPSVTRNDIDSASSDAADSPDDAHFRSHPAQDLHGAGARSSETVMHYPAFDQSWRAGNHETDRATHLQLIRPRTIPNDETAAWRQMWPYGYPDVKARACSLPLLVAMRGKAPERVRERRLSSAPEPEIASTPEQCERADLEESEMPWQLSTLNDLKVFASYDGADSSPDYGPIDVDIIGRSYKKRPGRLEPTLSLPDLPRLQPIHPSSPMRIPTYLLDDPLSSYTIPAGGTLSLTARTNTQARRRTTSGERFFDAPTDIYELYDMPLTTHDSSPAEAYTLAESLTRSEEQPPRQRAITKNGMSQHVDRQLLKVDDDPDANSNVSRMRTADGAVRMLTGAPLRRPSIAHVIDGDYVADDSKLVSRGPMPIANNIARATSGVGTDGTRENSELDKVRHKKSRRFSRVSAWWRQLRRGKNKTDDKGRTLSRR